jgi:hypothetical protein
VLAISCKGATKAFRNLTNRMEQTIGECTNLHITYPAMVVGYFVALRANRTIEDALQAPNLDPEEEASGEDREAPELQDPMLGARIERNDIAIRGTGEPVEEILRFHAALSELTGRRGIRDEISRYEAISMVLIEPTGTTAGDVVTTFPSAYSLLHSERFFSNLYQQYMNASYSAHLLWLAVRGGAFGCPVHLYSKRRAHNSPNSIIFPVRRGIFAYRAQEE